MPFASFTAKVSSWDRSTVQGRKRRGSAILCLRTKLERYAMMN
jgi:hypothetical protein